LVLVCKKKDAARVELMRFSVPNVKTMEKKKDVEGLIKALRWGTHNRFDKNFGKDELLCEEAARALGRIGDPRAIEPLLKFEGHTNAQHDGHCTELVQEALLSIAEKAGVDSLLEPLFNELRCSDYSTEQNVARILGKLGDWRAARPLVDALKNDIPEPRESHYAGDLGHACADALRMLMEKCGDSAWVTETLQKFKV
jgi:HEAT repeat protein